MVKSKTELTSQTIDNLSFDEGLNVKVVEIVGADGVLKNPASEETLRAVLAASGGSTHNFIQSDTDATYKYYGYASSTGWKFKRKTLATGIWMVAEGLGDYDTAWADRINKNFNYTT